MARPPRAVDKPSLLKSANELAAPKSSDWVKTDKPSDAAAGTLKLCEDKELREELIRVNAATVAQRPKGTLKRPFIIRLYPNFDAPQAPVKKRGSSTTRISTGAKRLPNISQMENLIARIQKEMTEVNKTMQSKLASEINRLKKNVANAEGDDFDRFLRELNTANDKKRNAEVEAQREAFKNIEADSSFEDRQWLWILNHD